jgi:hypothetical protein
MDRSKQASFQQSQSTGYQQTASNQMWEESDQYEDPNLLSNIDQTKNVTCFGVQNDTQQTQKEGRQPTQEILQCPHARLYQIPTLRISPNTGYFCACEVLVLKGEANRRKDR